MADQTAKPRELLSLPDGMLLMVGMVIGVGIFKAPSVVAGNTETTLGFLAVWLLGGLLSLCGALVYAELASRYPHTGGEYAFLMRGLGRLPGFLFAWSRMTVIQTGAIAAVAFVLGDYASELLSLGAQSSAIWAAIVVVALTAINFAGTLQSKSVQKLMEIGLISALVIISVWAIIVGGAPTPPTREASGERSLGLAMIFVLLTYGGWNEAAYITGEVRDARRNMTRILIFGIVLVTALYLLVNIGYIAVLGVGGVAQSKAVAADMMRVLAGEGGAKALAVVICVSAATTINAAIFTGARTSYAFGQDFRLFTALGSWRERGSTPANALVLQGGLTLVLIAGGSLTPDGFSAMVAYTSPVFWVFFLLTGATLFVFRGRGGEAPPFKTPLYPLVPLVFLGACAYMLWSSISYINNPLYGPKFGSLVLAGIAVMAAGIPLYWLSRK